MHTTAIMADPRGPRPKHAHRKRNRNAGLKVLSDIALHPKNCWEVLGALIAAYNHQHAVKQKDVSYKTQAERRKFLYLAFRQLQAEGYHLDPRSIGERHVQVLLERWVMDGLQPKTIQGYLSFLRALGDWIGKPGLVRSAGIYVANPHRVRCSGVAERDKSWAGAEVDVDAKIAEIDSADPLVSAQLAVMAAFGLRVKEALMLLPHRAIIAARETGLSKPAADNYLRVDRGTKGGRVRFVAMDCDAKWEAIERAQAITAAPDGHLGSPALPLKESMTRFRNKMAEFGITMAGVGIVPHGLRHQYAHSRYQQLAGALPPVCGGAPVPRAVDRCARLAVSADLGHAREQITGAYAGGIIRAHAAELIPAVARPAETDPAPTPSRGDKEP